MTQESATSKGVLRSLTRSVALLLGVSSVLSVHAQSYKPACAQEASYTSIDGSTMYVEGGIYADRALTNQAFTIDLSQSWDTSSPRYNQLASGYHQNHAPGGVSSDSKWWTMIIGNLMSRYNVETNSWNELETLSMDKTFGLTGATDPATDIMYIPFGYATNGKGIATMRVDLKTGEVQNDKKSHSMTYKTFYAAAWNPLLKSAIYLSPSGVFEYTWKKDWKKFSSKGLGKIPLRGACLVSVNDGKKMVFFGGTPLDQKSVLGDIFILDVKTKVWTKGPSAPSGGARKAPACAGSNGQVVIWGGTTANDSILMKCPAKEVLVFNVNTNKWTNRYVAPGQN